MLSREDVLIAGPHMPFPGLGRLYKTAPVVFTDGWVKR